jgi:hypothetical protein
MSSKVRDQRGETQPHGGIARQAGTFAVEFGLIVIMFFTILFMIMELARVLYVWNTLQEVTRRAAREASVTDFSDANAMTQVRQNAVFRSSPGNLALSAPVTDDYIRIDYMSIQSETNSQMKKVKIPTSALPACPARNLVTCTAKSGDASCIRLVRVRICAPGGDECNPIPYQALFSLVQFPINLPKAETIVQAESLGYVPGTPMCK